MMTRSALATVLLVASSAAMGCARDGASGSPLAPPDDASLARVTASCARPARTLPDQLTARNRATMRGGHSEVSNESVNIMFTNGTCQPVSVYWLDYQGNPVLYAILAPGQSYVQQTFVTHPWVIPGPTGVVRTGFMPVSGVPLSEAYIGE